MTFRRTTTLINWQEQLMVVFDDGQRVIAKDQDGVVALDISRALFDLCVARGHFQPA